MAVMLSAKQDAGPEPYAAWCVIGNAPAPLDPAKRRRGAERELEAAYDRIADTWRALGKALGDDPSAVLAHAPHCSGNASDLGAMLAWANLVETWAGEEETTLVICDDPWLFRHLSALPGVQAAAAPPLAWLRVKLALRGVLARARFVWKAARACRVMREQRRHTARGKSAIMAYGHPSSTPAGFDGYFGDLLNKLPGIVRVLHVDCPPSRARELAKGGRTHSLHAWGSLAGALSLISTRWRPSRAHLDGPYGWLVRRAAALEGATAQPASVQWQLHCQERWLETQRPRAVAWPWENHGWEREFARACRRDGVRSAGYQHTPFGRQEYGYSPASNADGADSLPDAIVCTGPATLETLQRQGCPTERLALGGSLRFAGFRAPPYDPAGPALFALPFRADIAKQMIEAATALKQAGRSILIKHHPMDPAGLDGLAPETRTDAPFADVGAISSVVFASSSIGLEALVGGIPALRFQPRGVVALDGVPPGIATPAANADELADALDRLERPAEIDRCRLASAPDLELWRRLLT